ncbi:MAG: NAD(P)/FAD-dependent oxidoreductase [Firmicutes bacterium]|nr:NAD(P)/FAD-dependent oxidoreductase [Bacillota bacterium]
MAEENIVILGAGYGGIKTAQTLNKLIDKHSDYKIILVDKNGYHTLVTQLYQTAAGTKNLSETMVPINKIFAQTDVQVVKGQVSNIDIENNCVIVNDDKKISFKYLINALGSEPEYFNIKGLAENSVCLKNLIDARKIRCKVNNILEQLSKQQLKQRQATFVIGGGGLTGVEFAGELAEQLRKTQDNYNINTDDYKIVLVEGTQNLLPGMSSKVYLYAQKALEDSGVEVITGDLIKEVTNQTIFLASGREIKHTTLIWTGGIKGNSVASKFGLKTDDRNRVIVNQYLQSVDNPKVYAVGDSALAIDVKSGQPVVATAQAAMQQGKCAAYNVYADIKGIKKKVYQSALILLLIHIGCRRAVGEPVNKMKRLKLKGTLAAWIKRLIPLKYSLSLGGVKMLTHNDKKKVLKLKPKNADIE